MFKKGSVSWAIWNYVEAALLVIGGILCMAFSGNADLQKWALIILGIFVIVDAGLRLVLDVINVFELRFGTVVTTSYASAVYGSLELAVGIALIVIGNDLSTGSAIFTLLGNFIGILLIVLGSIALIYGIIFLARKIQTVGYSILTLVVGALGITAGILCLIYLTGSNVIQLSLIVFGLLALLVGILLIATTTIALTSKHKVEKVIDEKK